MEILTFIWQQYLYAPLFNLLIWIYLNYSFYNLGIAIIILTVLVRIILLPFTVLTEKGKIISMRLKKEVREIKKDFAGDPVKQKVMIRELLRKKKIRHWSKAIVLGFQGLVLVLLYQVFVGGINTAKKLHFLYPGVPKPDFINTKFLWLDISQRSLSIAAIVGVYLFLAIFIGNWKRRQDLTKKEQVYSLFFPFSVFLVLAILPSAKSIFVLTSLVFSSIISMFAAFIKLSIKKAQGPTN